MRGDVHACPGCFAVEPEPRELTTDTPERRGRGAFWKGLGGGLARRVGVSGRDGMEKLLGKVQSLRTKRAARGFNYICFLRALGTALNTLLCHG